MASSSVNRSINVDDDNEAEEDVEITDTDATQIGEQPKAVSGKTGKEYSDVWNYFKKHFDNPDKIARARCIACNKEYKCGGRGYGTSHLGRHLPKCPKLKYNDIGQMVIDYEGKIKTIKLDQRIARDLLAEAIIKHDLPFFFVEYDGFRRFVKYLNPEFRCISRNTVVSDINAIYLREKAKLKKALEDTPNRICLTSDLWTAVSNEGYICLTAHFVDVDWKLNSKILNFDHMPPPHSGVEMAAKALEYLKEWGVEKKVFSLTLDNASSNDNMQENLKEQLGFLDDSLFCDGEFFHIRCCAHILNLIVQEGLKIVNVALQKIRDSVKYLRYESRMKKFEECVRQVGNIDTRVGLRFDVSTRWNSTYLMLDSAIKYKKAFTLLQLNDRNYKYCPSMDEWSRGEKICEFLQPFYDTTNLISGTSYPTANLYFVQIWKIECLLRKNMSSKDELISEMSRNMKEKFNKYWAQYSTVLAFGAVLDPRMKLSMLEYFYSKTENNPTETKEKMLLVKRKLYKLFGEYSKEKITNDSTTSSSQPCFVTTSQMEKNGGLRKGKGKRLFDECLEYESETVIIAGKSQLDLYLEEPKLEFAFYEDLDVLEHWKCQKNRYPILARMACDVLAIPITTVASESSFSIGGRILTKYRSCILPRNVQSLICARNWLYGFGEVNEDEDFLKASLSNLSSEGSNVVEVEDE